MGLLNHNQKNTFSGNVNSQINSQMFQQLKNAMGMIQSAQNPQMVLQQVAQRNPQIATIMQMCNGKDPQKVFYSLCQQQGVDPNFILSQLM